MRKSSIILLIAGVLALAWTAAYFWMAGSSIRELRSGGVGRFTEKPPVPDVFTRDAQTPFTGIDVAGTNQVFIIEKDSGCSLGMMDHTRMLFRISVHDSVLQIRQTRPGNTSFPDTIRLNAPHLRFIRFYRYGIPLPLLPSLEIQNFSQPCMILETNGVGRLRLSGCTVSDMTLISGSFGIPEATILDPGCRFDSLSIRRSGTGTLEIGAAGIFKNTFLPGDSVQILAPAPVLKKLLNTGTIDEIKNNEK